MKTITCQEIRHSAVARGMCVPSPSRHNFLILAALLLQAVLLPNRAVSGPPTLRPQDPKAPNPPSHCESWWRQKVAEYIDQITDDEARDRALNDFSYMRVRAGDLEGARKAAPRIGNTQLRVFAHIFIAKHLALSGNRDECLVELQRARPVALADDGRYQMIDAYLDHARSEELALSFVEDISDRRARKYRMQFLVRALAQRGDIDNALAMVDKHIVADERQRALAGMAGAAATSANIDAVRRLAPMLGDKARLDAVWKGLVEALARRSRQDEASQLLDRISDTVVRAQANAAIGRVAGVQMAEITTDELRSRIENAVTREEKQILLDTLLQSLLAAENASGAEATIQQMVANIKASPRKPQPSKFGTTDDVSAIAAARSKYLDVAALQAKLGDDEASRASLSKARAAIVGMSDATGIGKMMLVMKLLQTQLGFGDLPGARDTLNSVKPAFKRMVSGQVAVEFIRAGDVDTAMEMARSALKSGRPGRDIGDIASEFIRIDKLNAARELLAQVGDGRDDIQAFRSAGNMMLVMGRGQELSDWLNHMSVVARTYLCLGAAETLFSRVACPPGSDQERAVVEFLTIPTESLPAGYALDRTHVTSAAPATANPGVYRRDTIPSAIEHFQSHRSGPFVTLENAYRAIYRNKDDGLDIEILGFTFPDAASAERTREQLYVKSFVDWYFQKGRLLFYVRRSHPKARSARDAIQLFLEQKELPPGAARLAH